ncbi:MAG TPA: DUF2096 family protein [Candidatus Bathyarchaeia archaeon]|nr:DUF2096 family protein [Candidatus Bathyarchaeia archaeon]
MRYDNIWKTLDSLIVEFRKRGETIPANVIEDLRAAKTLIQVLKADPTHQENVPSIELYLGNVESYLIFEAHQRISAEFAELWLQKLREARKATHIGEEEPFEPSSKFVSGAPKDQKWLRVQVSNETPKSEIKKIAAECGVSTKIQPDGYILVYGDENMIKSFIQKTAEKLQRRKAR